MRIPTLFVPEKDLEKKINEFTKEVSEERRIVRAKEFYGDRTHKAVMALLKEDYEPLFMPSIIDARIEASGDERIWKTWYCAPSIVATGRTKQGKGVAVFAHVPNYFSKPEKVTRAIDEGLVGGAGRIPEAEFERLLSVEDGVNVFVVDYKALRRAGNDRFPVGKALMHPMTVPFLGGRERAERYLDRHAEVYGEKIGIWYSDHLNDVPVGRLLFLGHGDYYYGGLDGGSSLSNDGRFVGVRKSAEGAARNIENGSRRIILEA